MRPKTEIDLTGLRGSEPLAFLASLTVLDIARRRLDPDARLSWRARAGTNAVLHVDGGTLDDVIAAVTAERDGLRHSGGVLLELPPGFPFPPEKKGSKGGDPARTLPAENYREFAAQAQRQELAGDPRAARWLSGIVTELARGVLHDRSQKDVECGVTAFYLLAKQMNLHQQLADALACSADQPDGVRSALCGPWRRSEGYVGANLDRRAVRSKADAPVSKTVNRGMPTVTWLALMALRFLTVVGDGRRATTRGWRHLEGAGHKADWAFVWPLWEPPLDLDATLVLLDSPWLTVVEKDGRLHATHREGWGIHSIYAAGIEFVGEPGNETRVLGCGRRVG